MMDGPDTDRRTAIKAMAAGSMLALPATVGAATGIARDDSEADWSKVRDAYVPQHPLNNLNNAACSPPPLIVQEAMIMAYRFANENPDVNMWDKLDNGLEGTKAKLALLADCDPAEIALNRNSTEGLCVAIFGLPMKAGDAVLLSDWDFPSMRQAWEQRRARDGIAIVPVAFDLMADDDAIVEAYSRAITPKTRAIQLTHMIHWTGRVLPVARICAIARARGIMTVVDGAQSFGHIPLSFRQLGCDYFVTSLHKWMCAPFGNGMLIMRSERIDGTWPLLAPFDPPPLRIDKFDHFNLGTYNSAAQTGIEPAIDFHEAVGGERKFRRLQSLTRYWVERASDIPGFRLHVPVDHPSLGAVSLFSIDGLQPERIERRLQAEFAIRVRMRRSGALEGVRVSPHIYTLKADLDRLVDSLRRIARTA